ncbi:similar to RIKEN cDNA 0610037L13, isoform CRA_a [Rattus norvegicus]|uniref:CXXC motif containing zinc binding protein n=1 Tax=Rattus norvegicus TaxID=10116 RepID=A6JYT1_RAT|nr:similar to RIKEN cDNA 0610037L13, isoform CRA_a [Rattus norvegicus]
MGKIALQLKATLENVTNLRPVGEDFRWYLKMKCGNCGEISEKWQYIRLMDSVALKGGRGSASMVQKCKLCARENSIEILSSTIKSYNAEDNEKFKTIVEFECRGLEPVDFQPQAGFAAEGVESGTVFSDINLQEKGHLSSSYNCVLRTELRFGERHDLPGYKTKRWSLGLGCLLC